MALTFRLRHGRRGVCEPYRQRLREARGKPTRWLSREESEIEVTSRGAFSSALHHSLYTHAAVRESDSHRPFRHRPARVAHFVPFETVQAAFLLPSTFKPKLAVVTVTAIAPH